MTKQPFAFPLLFIGSALAALLLFFSPIKGSIALGSGALLALAVFAVMQHKNMRLFPFLLMVGVVLGQFLRYQVSQDTSAALLPIDIIATLFTVSGFLFIAINRRPVTWTSSLTILVLFLLWMLVSLLFGLPDLNGREQTIALLYAIRFVIMCGSLLVLTTLVTKQVEAQTLYRALITTGLILAGLGFLQLVFFPDFAFMARYGWDPHEGRLLSTFFDPNFFGMFLVMIISLVFSQLLITPGRIVQLGSTTLFLLFALLLTFSRSSYLALLISLFIILFVRAWRLVFVGLLIVLIMGGSIPRVRDRVVGAFRVDDTSQDRLQSWRQTFVIIRDKPWTGVGYNAFGPAQVHYNLQKNLLSHASRGSDSSLLLVFATTGVIGLLLYLFFWIALWGQALFAYRFSGQPLIQSVSLALIGLVPSYLIHSQFVNGLFYPLLFIPFSFIMAILYWSLKPAPPSV